MPVTARPSANMQAVTPDPQVVTMGLPGLTPGRLERRLKLRVGFQRAVRINQSVVGKVVRSGHMPQARHWARLGFMALEPRFGSRVQDLLALRFNSRFHVAQIADKLGVSSRRKVPLRAERRRPRLQGTALLPPLQQAAIQHRDVGMAHHPEGPPYPGRAENSAVVVDDGLHPIAYAHFAHARCELLGRGQHVGQRRGGVGDLIDIEKECARDVGFAVNLIGIARIARQGERGVDDRKPRRAQTLVKPAGLHKPFRREIGHAIPHRRSFLDYYSETSGTAGSSSSQGGTGKPFSRRNGGLNILDW